ncbi:MAG: PDZ domain-containing protein [Chloroflexia bacterium]
MTIKFNRWILGLAATLALLLFFVAGGVVGYMYAGDGGPNAGATASLPVDSGSGPSKEEVWKPFWETYELVHKEFYGRPVDEKKLMNAATQGMVSSLGDPYTSYLPPAEHARAQEELRGRFEGIGVYVDVKNKQFLIVAPIEDSPAAKAGLKSGDVITAVNGEKITGLDQQVVIGKIRGPKGTSVMLTIKRGNQPLFDVKVMRDEIRVAQVKYTLIQNDIAYIDVNIFGDQTTLELDSALRQAKQDGARASC